MKPVIRIRNLVRIFRSRNVRFRALGGVNLDIMQGQSVAIVGASGSGKSTLLNLIAGLDKPTSGKIFVRDSPVHRMSEEELTDFRLANVGIIFQNYRLLPTLNTLENAAFPLMLRGVDCAERTEKARALLRQLGLSSHLSHDVDELSGGQQQRVAIARALIDEPPILLADEPTGNLDSNTADQILDLLQRMVKDRRTTLLMVTHDLGRVHHADRIIHIADGEIVEDRLIAGAEKSLDIEE
ncbi:MAG: ABC transporter ATP-binding protein [Clostridia bacterium]|nr:ABC transporter ATP-binding protein [Clostridia bacterium]